MSAILTVERLLSGYADVPVLENVSLEVREGEIVSVVGANGAGKTTLLSTISGLVRARRGAIAFRGMSIAASRRIKSPSGGWPWCPKAAGSFLS